MNVPSLAVPWQFLMSFCSFTFAVWLLLQPGFSGRLPILCTLTPEVCLYVENGVVKADLNRSTISGATTLTALHWNHLVLRYDAQGMTYDFFFVFPQINYSYGTRSYRKIISLSQIYWLLLGITINKLLGILVWHTIVFLRGAVLLSVLDVMHYTAWNTPKWTLSMFEKSSTQWEWSPIYLTALVDYFI